MFNKINVFLFLSEIAFIENSYKIYVLQVHDRMDIENKCIPLHPSPYNEHTMNLKQEIYLTILHVTNGIK